MRFLIYFCLALFISFPIHHVQANENEPTLINTYEEDVTGKGKMETIKLYGVPFSEETVYYQDIYVTIESDHENWRIDYQGGYDPTLQFLDLNHDGVLDIFYQSPTGGSGGIYTTQLDTIVNQTLTSIPLPEQEYVSGSFEDDFQVVIKIAPNTDPIVINVEDGREDYIRMGVYNEEGKVLTDTSLMIDPIAFFEPIEISEKQGYGLKSYKQISGTYHADRLGVIETLWYYQDGNWISLQTEWIDSGDYDASKFY